MNFFVYKLIRFLPRIRLCVLAARNAKWVAAPLMVALLPFRQKQA